MLTFNITMGILGGLISLIGYIPYNLSSIKKKTKPNRTTWWTFTLVGGISLASYTSGGASITHSYYP